VWSYLAQQGVTTTGELEIEWCLAPYVAIWTLPKGGAANTWVISGDLPTDYLSDARIKRARSAAKAFGRRWLEVAEHLLQGRQHPTIAIGRGQGAKKLKTLGDLLQRRANLLVQWSNDPSKWEE
jgi:hypothetical protein